MRVRFPNPKSVYACHAQVDAAERRAELAERQKEESHRLLLTLQVR